MRTRSGNGTAATSPSSSRTGKQSKDDALLPTIWTRKEAKAYRLSTCCTGCLYRASLLHKGPAIGPRGPVGNSATGQYCIPHTNVSLLEDVVAQQTCHPNPFLVSHRWFPGLRVSTARDVKLTPVRPGTRGPGIRNGRTHDLPPGLTLDAMQTVCQAITGIVPWSNKLQIAIVLRKLETGSEVDGPVSQLH